MNDLAIYWNGLLEVSVALNVHGGPSSADPNLQTTPKATVLPRVKRTTSHLRPKKTSTPSEGDVGRVELQVSELDKSATAPITADLLPLDDVDEDKTAVNSSSDEISAKKADGKVSPSTTQSLNTLLSHHRSEQESLTEDLAKMASILKANSLAFSDALSKDKSLLENAESKLDKNFTSMQTQQGKLKGYQKKAGVSFWFSIAAVAGVGLAWFFMFGLMRIA